MLKTNLMRSVILFTNLLPFMKFGLTKQDNARVTADGEVSLTTG
jgi:hypothetical protein